MDALRILACILVVCYHSPVSLNNDSAGHNIFLSANSLLCIPCIGLFFAVSGHLLLPTRLPLGAFIRRRLSKIFIPTLFWALTYTLVEYFFSPGKVPDLGKALLSLPWTVPGCGEVLWFMYSLTGLYLISPIISPWLRQASRRELRFCLILWFISQCYPVLSPFLTVPQGPGNMLYYFAGYVGYFLLGYYIKRFPEDFKVKVWGMLYVCAWLLSFPLRRWWPGFNFSMWYGYISPMNPILVAGLFSVCKAMFKGDVSETNWMSRLAALTFGIYLVHIGVLKYIVFKFPFMLEMTGYVRRSLLADGMVFFISLAIVWIIWQTPLSQWLIGIPRRRQPRRAMLP